MTRAMKRKLAEVENLPDNSLPTPVLTSTPKKDEYYPETSPVSSPSPNGNSSVEVLKCHTPISPSLPAAHGSIAIHHPRSPNVKPVVFNRACLSPINPDRTRGSKYCWIDFPATAEIAPDLPMSSDYVASGPVTNIQQSQYSTSGYSQLSRSVLSQNYLATNPNYTHVPCPVQPTHKRRKLSPAAHRH